MTYLEKSKQIATEMARANPGQAWGFREKRNGDYVGEVTFDGKVLEITEYERTT